MPKLKKGIQIIYVPMHVAFRKVYPLVPEHIPDEQIGLYTQEIEAFCYIEPRMLPTSCEAGFVMEVRGDAAFCRYWNIEGCNSLRTTSCSELTPKDRLLVVSTHHQSDIDKWIKYIEDERRDGR